MPFKIALIVVLTRQDVSALDRMTFAAAGGLRHGAYILADAANGKPDLILITTGSEVALIVAVEGKLRERNTQYDLFPGRVMPAAIQRDNLKSAESRRPSVSRVKWQQHLDAQRASGLLQSVYCRDHGLNEKYFSLWKRTVRDNKVSPQLVKFHPGSQEQRIFRSKCTLISTGDGDSG